MNGNDVLVYEEKNCERLQEEFVKSRRLNILAGEFDQTLEGDNQLYEDYFNFVLEDMNG